MGLTEYGVCGITMLCLILVTIGAGCGATTRTLAATPVPPSTALPAPPPLAPTTAPEPVAKPVAPLPATQTRTSSYEGPALPGKATEPLATPRPAVVATQRDAPPPERLERPPAADTGTALATATPTMVSAGGAADGSPLKLVIEDVLAVVATRYSLWDRDVLILLHAKETEWGSTALGCPEEGESYADVMVEGWEFRILHRGAGGEAAIVRLHASRDLSTLKACQGEVGNLTDLYPIRVERVVDGDTVAVVPAEGGSGFRVRLGDVDAHEACTDLGRRATRFAYQWVAQASALHLLVEDVDQYGRVVGYVIDGANGTSMNAALVRSGMAFVYGGFGVPDNVYQAETEANARGVGVWSSPGGAAITVDGFARPWDWRKALRCKDGQVAQR